MTQVDIKTTPLTAIYEWTQAQANSEKPVVPRGRYKIGAYIIRILIQDLPEGKKNFMIVGVMNTLKPMKYVDQIGRTFFAQSMFLGRDEEGLSTFCFGDGDSQVDDFLEKWDLFNVTIMWLRILTSNSNSGYVKMHNWVQALEDNNLKII